MTKNEDTMQTAVDTKKMDTTCTHLVNTVYLNQNTGLYSTLLNHLFLTLQPILQQEFIMMQNKKVWLDRQLLALYPRPDAYDIPLIGYSDSETVIGYKKEIEGFAFTAPTLEECQTTFAAKRKNPYMTKTGELNFYPDCPYKVENKKGESAVKDELSRIIYVDHIATKTPYNSEYVNDFCTVNAACRSIWNDLNESEYCILIPIHHLVPILPKSRPTDQEVLELLAQNHLIPQGLGDEEKNYKLLMDRGELCKLMNNCEWKAPALDLKEYNIPLQSVKEQYLQCDFLRANISPYNEKRLTDINLGHWELWEPPAEKNIKINLPGSIRWAARPPQMDIRDGICAIDFGTKSTVVACRDETQDERLLRIGKGDISAEPAAADYENPTVVELRHYEAFQRNYSQRDGRPFTRWEDVTVSHQAADAIFIAKDSGAYYTVFNELKQWANEPRRRMLLQDLDGKTIELKPFLDLQPGDFNPIELYAYYLGLYINNMNSGIYLDYILSYPVNYSVAVREKIRSSFEQGLKKSLPPAVLHDADLMKRFRIQNGCSEPAAYAITALKEFGISPKSEEEKIAYGVFDFGGGTTDFDFGIASLPPKRYNLQIEQLGYGGDSYLGGENILMMMAYEVFKENVEAMRKDDIHIILPHGVRRFAGSEILVEDRESASKEAYLNTRMLQQKLRPIWERQDGWEGLFADEQSVSLYGSGGKKKEIHLKISRQPLEQLISSRIQDGVDSFFAKLKESLKGQKYNGRIHIFLAGNSCKSVVVRDLFKQYIQAEENQMAETMKAQGLYDLHMPLGMQDQDNTTAEKKESGAKKQWDRIRTGKTSVAFGLLRCRKGARDVKIISRNEEENTEGKLEVKFPYYLGEIQRNGHFQITVGLDIGYGVWTEYIDASEDEFELRYTSDSRAQDGTLTDGDISMVHCYLDADEVRDDDSYGVYVCKKDPETLQYAVGHLQQNNGKTELEFLKPEKIHEVKLRKNE